MRKICVITGTRADFGILTPVIKEIINHSELELSLVVTGMHLVEDYGYTITDIRDQGFPIDAEIKILESVDTGAAMARALGRAIIGFSENFEKIKPDIVLLLGDRGEMLAAAIAASHMNIITAHLHGGEISGTIDDLTRNAITKFSSIHLPATKISKKNIEAMNENSERIFVVGAPGLDPIFTKDFSSKEKIVSELNIDPNNQLLIIIQHPNTFEIEESANQIKETLEAVSECKIQSILIYPNSDAGGKAMIDVIKEYEKLPFLRTFKSLPRDHYLGLLAIADTLIGNSSSGIIEASALGIPVVNIGTRQNGREQAKSVLNVDYSKEKIKKAIELSLTKEYKDLALKARSPYGSGNSSKKIVKILSEIPLDRKMVEKT